MTEEEKQEGEAAQLYQGRRRGRPTLPMLPCGCEPVKGATTLPDGGKICKAHAKRYVLGWIVSP